MNKRKYIYRFKTKNEFIKEYGDRWRDKVRCSWVEEMDYALGMTIENEIHSTLRNIMRYDVIDRLFSDENDDYNFHISIGRRGFSASIDMITKELSVPSYKPKNFVY